MKETSLYRHRILWLIVLAIAVIGTALLFKRATSPESSFKPEVLNVGTSGTTIAWFSKEKYIGRVFYTLAATEGSPLSATETFGDSNQHEVILTGLQPSARYTYWLGNSQARFQFQTQPTASSPFSFLLVWGNVSDRIASLLRSEAGEFIISMNAAGEQKSDWFADVRPYVPIYNLYGVDSPFLKATESAHHAGLWKLDWGGFRLIFAGQAANADKIIGMLDTPAAHTIGIITSLDTISFPGSKRISEIDVSLSQTNLQSILTAHNKQQPTRPVAFVAIVGTSNKNIEVDGVQYFGIDTAKQAGAIRVDVDVESARAVFLDENREVALKQPPLKQKRTCEECRRLADKGAYEESVKAYLEFIETHKGNYQIDDAYFAIADIYDSKLFKFEKALDWYRRLIKEYPDGTLTPPANQRIKYISTYADHDYKPLTAFERIKAVEYARKKEQPQERDKIFDEVKSLIRQYPDSNIAPVAQHWLANQYRLNDPDKAIEAYTTLRKNYRGHDEAQEAMIEIGETYYDAGRYKEAIKAYSEAIDELPAMTDTIKAQISRSERNMRRDTIAYACWAIVVFILTIALLRKPRRIDGGKIARCIAAFTVMWALLSFGAWLIHEQFNSTREMILIVSSFSIITGLSTAVSMKVSRNAMIGSLAGVLFFLAGIYLSIYYIYIHYLIVVKL